MNKKKIFGVSANTSMKNEYDVRCTGVSCDYIEAIQLAGGVPLMLPPLAEQADLERQLDSLDVLVVSGGEDMHPSTYGEEPLPLLGEMSPDRDLFELQLVRLAYKRNIPIFGICRGLQVINVAFGGTLYQDLSLLQASIPHLQKLERHEPFHSIDVDETSLLYEILQEKTIQINSFHHQGVKQLAAILRANCYSSDGLVEGVEGMDEGKAPVLGVQWHPEMMAVAGNPSMLKLFQYFNGVLAMTAGGLP